MNSGTIATARIPTRQRGHSSTARRFLFGALARIRHGRLVIQHDDDVTVFGQEAGRTDLVAHIHIHDADTYRALMLGGSTGAAEAWMAGQWTSPDLTQVIRVLARNLPALQQVDGGSSLLLRLGERFMHAVLRDNSKSRARRNIRAHYDLSNDFFGLFLDSSMMYSAAIYPHSAAGLEEAARFKVDHICRRLQLKPTDHLLEIGTGWGGLALHAAQHYGCRVTTTTISRAQYEHATAAAAQAGLSDRITVLERDYRDLEGRFDKLVSVEMIEAVGHRYFGQYFRKCSELLADDGLMLIQAITIPDQRYESARRSVDFIQKYIFPGGALPSVGVIAGHVARDTDMEIVGLEEIGLHYARTLTHWRERFLARLDDVRALGFDDTFIRMWEFYLAYCEGGFLERVIGTSQLLLAKPRCHQLPGAL